MKPLYDILTTLKNYCESEIPALLTAAGLDAFDIYAVGGSRNAKQKGFFIYQDLQTYTYDEDRITIIFQLQLYGIDELIAAKYTDVIAEYLFGFEPENIECDLLENLTVDTWPIEQTSTTFVYITILWKSQLDSCDN